MGEGMAAQPSESSTSSVVFLPHSESLSTSGRRQPSFILAREHSALSPGRCLRWPAFVATMLDPNGPVTIYCEMNIFGFYFSTTAAAAAAAAGRRAGAGRVGYGQAG